MSNISVKLLTILLGLLFKTAHPLTCLNNLIAIGPFALPLGYPTATNCSASDNLCEVSVITKGNATMHGQSCALQGTYIPPGNMSWWFQSSYALYNSTVFLTRESACNYTNCNVKAFTPVVNSCYNYGTIYSISSTGVKQLIYNGGTTPNTSNTTSIENQYCLRVRGLQTYRATNSTYLFDWYIGHESCLIGLFSTLEVSCCQTDNCNFPINRALKNSDLYLIIWKFILFLYYCLF